VLFLLYCVSFAYYIVAMVSSPKSSLRQGAKIALAFLGNGSRNVMSGARRAVNKLFRRSTTTQPVDEHRALNVQIEADGDDQRAAGGYDHHLMTASDQQQRSPQKRPREEGNETFSDAQSHLVAPSATDNFVFTAPHFRPIAFAQETLQGGAKGQSDHAASDPSSAITPTTSPLHEDGELPFHPISLAMSEDEELPTSPCLIASTQLNFVRDGAGSPELSSELGSELRCSDNCAIDPPSLHDSTHTDTISDELPVNAKINAGVVLANPPQAGRPHDSLGAMGLQVFATRPRETHAASLIQPILGYASLAPSTTLQDGATPCDDDDDVMIVDQESYITSLTASQRDTVSGASLTAAGSSTCDFLTQSSQPSAAGPKRGGAPPPGEPRGFPPPPSPPSPPLPSIEGERVPPRMSVPAVSLNDDDIVDDGDAPSSFFSRF
jgi:hypothetical protein